MKIVEFFKKTYATIKNIILNPINFLRSEWEALWKWLALAHSSSDEASAKRFYGGVGIISCIVMLYMFAAGIFPITNWKDLAPYWLITLLTSVGMISLGVLEKLTEIISTLKLEKFKIEATTSTTTTINPSA